MHWIYLNYKFLLNSTTSLDNTTVKEVSPSPDGIVSKPQVKKKKVVSIKVTYCTTFSQISPIMFLNTTPRQVQLMSLLISLVNTVCFTVFQFSYTCTEIVADPCFPRNAEPVTVLTPVFIYCTNTELLSPIFIFQCWTSYRSQFSYRNSERQQLPSPVFTYRW